MRIMTKLIVVCLKSDAHTQWEWLRSNWVVVGWVDFSVGALFALISDDSRQCWCGWCSLVAGEGNFENSLFHRVFQKDCRLVVRVTSCVSVKCDQRGAILGLPWRMLQCSCCGHKVSCSESGLQRDKQRQKQFYSSSFGGRAQAPT